MKLRAYAKINLGLHVVGKRPDGYHNIETVFHQVDLFDEIEIVQSEEEIHFTSDAPELRSDSSNLCIRAVNLLRDITGVHTGVEITLKKRIPIGAGLGGGSTDSAAVLKGLSKMWALDVTDDELMTVSASLGSDVPYFMVGGTAYATGRGEILEPLDLAIPFWILLVTPALHVSTTWAYTSLKPAQTIQRENLPILLRTNINNAPILREKLRNEFEPVVFGNYPEVQQIKETLLNRGAELALMSGSGSSVFGFFGHESTVQKLAADLSPQYRVSLTEPLFKP
ncbi:MAG: 4-(cytidine 5'-diphospho)-2-C-methyl-D-erythritol kinase [Bacteroidota bacterium]